MAVVKRPLSLAEWTAAYDAIRPPTHGDIARHLQISEAWWSLIRAGKVVPSREVALRIAAYTGVPIEAIRPEEPDEPHPAQTEVA